MKQWTLAVLLAASTSLPLAVAAEEKSGYGLIIGTGPT